VKQIPLFDVEDQKVHQGTSPKWLEKVSGWFAILNDLPASKAAIRKAALEVAHLRSTGPYGEHFDKAFVPLITSPKVVATLEQQWLKRAAKLGITEVTGICIEAIPGVNPCADLMVTFVRAEDDIVMPVNVKTAQPTGNSLELGLSLRAFIRHAIDPDFDIRTYVPARKLANADGLLLEWHAHRTKIVKNRDYYIWSVAVDPEGAVVSHRTFGLLSTLNDEGKPIVARHSSREVVNIKKNSGRVIPADYDIAAAISHALLPRRGWSQARLYIAASLVLDGHASTEVTSKLLEMSDVDLAQALLRVIEAAE